MLATKRLAGIVLTCEFEESLSPRLQIRQVRESTLILKSTEETSPKFKNKSNTGLTKKTDVLQIYTLKKRTKQTGLDPHFMKQKHMKSRQFWFRCGRAPKKFLTLSRVNNHHYRSQQ